LGTISSLTNSSHNFAPILLSTHDIPYRGRATVQKNKNVPVTTTFPRLKSSRYRPVAHKNDEWIVPVTLHVSVFCTSERNIITTLDKRSYVIQQKPASAASLQNDLYGCQVQIWHGHPSRHQHWRRGFLLLLTYRNICVRLGRTPQREIWKESLLKLHKVTAATSCIYGREMFRTQMQQQVTLPWAMRETWIFHSNYKYWI
jgi:hypothetical protein